MNLAEHLVLIETFHGLDDEQYAALAARFEKYRAGVGEAIIKQGDLINRFVIVEEGIVVLRHTDPSGAVSIVDTLAAGRYFGEQMFTTQELANYDADAANGATLYVIKRDTWDDLLAQRPDLLPHLDHLRAELHQLTRGLKWLAPGEVVVHFGRKHWIGLAESLVKPGLLALLGLAVALVLLTFDLPLPVKLEPNWIYTGLGIALVLAVLWGLAEWYDFSNDEHIITNKRIVHTERDFVFNEHHEEIPIEKIQQVTIQRGNLLQVLLGVSKVWLESAAVKRDGERNLGDVELESIHHGELIRQVVEAQRDKVRARVAAEVRARTQGRMERELAHYVSPQPPPVIPNARPKAAPAPFSRSELIRRVAHQALGQRLVEGDTITYRKHWFALFGQIRLWFILLIVWIAVSIVYFWSGLDLVPVPASVAGAVILGLLFLGGVVYEWEDWRNDIYRLSPLRVIDIERKPFGIDEKSTTAFLENIQDVKVEMPTFLNSQFKYGDVLIYTAGAKEPMTFHNVRGPREISMEIFKRMETAKIRKAERDESMRNRQLIDALVAYHRLVGRDQEKEGSPEFKLALPPAFSLEVNASGIVPLTSILTQVHVQEPFVPVGQVTLTQDPPPDAPLAPGKYEITVTANDEGGNSTTAKTFVQVEDKIPPRVKCPDSLAVAADSDCTANIPNILPNVRVSDNATPSERVHLAQEPKAGTRVGAGIHAIRVTATDAAGNSASDEMLLTVVDRNPPRLRAPGVLYIQASPDSTAVIPRLITRVRAEDDCTPVNELVWTQTPEPGTPVYLGTELVTITVTDTAGNTSTAQIQLNIVNKPVGFWARLATFFRITSSGEKSGSPPNGPQTAWRPSARSGKPSIRVIVPDKESHK
ncbi:MAG TPA: cyclic nucleotide-binding domain-containing protein [Anaerolineae bacterium]